MQAEVSSLPVVQLSPQKSSIRKENLDTKNALTPVKVRSSIKSATCLPVYKKPLNPLLGGPYRSNTKQQSIAEAAKKSDANLCQRVLSAKMLRLKQLQNQLADAHYHLNELANENRLLKALQKRQDTALKRYEGTNAELPRIINTHHEELRVLQIKYKKLKAVHKETCDQLKERENEILCLQGQNKHLSQLSKDRNLQEREKLQLRVSDLTHRIQQQQETIQGLQRKLSIESRSMKHQLQSEKSKRKEAQKNLEEAIYKLHNLETLLDNRDKRLYYNRQLQTTRKEKRFATQSLTNLRDVSVINMPKLPMDNRKSEKSVEKDNSTLREISECSDEKSCDNEKCNIPSTLMLDTFKTETMASFQQIRKYRLQKSLRMQNNCSEIEGCIENTGRASPNENDSNITKDDMIYCNESNSSTCEKLYENDRFDKFGGTNSVFRVHPDYSSEATESDDESGNSKVNFCFDTAITSRTLHARLISSVDEDEDTPIMKESNKNARIQINDKEIDEIETGVLKNVIGICLSESELHIPLKQNSSVDRISITMKDYEGNLALGSTNDILQSEIQNYSTENIKTNSPEENEYKSFETPWDCGSIQTILNEHGINNDIETEKNYQYKQLSSENEAELLFQQEHFSNSSKHNENDLKTMVYAVNDLEITHDSNQREESNEREDSNESNKNSESVFAHDSHSYNVNIINCLNTQETSVEVENVKALPNNIVYAIQDNQYVGLNKDVGTVNKVDDRVRTINYDKEKLLATMRAIDNNENIEFINQEYQKPIAPSRKQITENLYRGVPTHTKLKQDILNDIFSASSIENKSNDNYSKLH